MVNSEIKNLYEHGLIRYTRLMKKNSNDDCLENLKKQIYTISLNYTFLQILEHCGSSMMKESKHERVRWAAKLIFTVGFFNIY